MKITKNQLSVAIISILLLVGASTILILQYALDFDFFSHPILNFLFVLECGFGLMLLIMGIVKKFTWFYFSSAILLSLVIIYLFAQIEFWWVGLIIAVVFCVIVGLFSFITVGNQIDDMSLNNSPEYKNFEQRQSEKEEFENSQEEEELPTIKSFKD